MRGKAVVAGQRAGLCRITPAYAGKSLPIRHFCINMEDHPRLCGEKAPHWTGKSVLLGSPPPMRGKGQAVLDFLRRARITPAYAGKSSSLWVL